MERRDKKGEMEGRYIEGLEMEECSEDGEASHCGRENIYTIPHTASINADTDTAEESRGPWWGVRHTLGLLIFTGLLFAILVRVSLSMAIVAMVGSAPPANHTANITDVCPPRDGQEDDSYVEGEFDWDEQTQGIILGAFFYGYTSANFIGGRVAEYLGGRLMFGLAVTVPAALSLLSPLCASVSKELFIVLRVLEGITQAVLYPSIHAMLPAWIPPQDRGSYFAVVFSGSVLGTIVSMAVGGVLCNSQFLGGWPSVFYIFGVLGLLWGLPWYLLAHDLPEHHPHISDAELAYITKHRTFVKRDKRVPLPWRDIATSIPFWSLVVVNLGFNYTNYNLLTEMPTYFTNIQHFNLSHNGVLSALPYVVQWVATVGWAAVVSAMSARNIGSIGLSRKLSTAIGMYTSVGALVAMLFVDCNSTASIIVMCIAVGAMGTINSGFACSEQDIAPNFAGSLKGISNTVGAATGIIAPAVTGAIINNNQTLSAWRTVFLVAAALSLACTTQFLFFTTTKVQPWNNISYHQENSEQHETHGYQHDVILPAREH